MRLLDVLNAPWAIVREKLLEIREIYLTHLRGEKIDLREVEASLGRPPDNTPKGYDVLDGVAVLPIEGVIAKRMNLFMEISGGVSTQLLERDFKAALDNREAHSILLYVDSPGGTVDGTQELARLIREARGRKPVVALIDGLGASAAYWLASAAERVFITGDTTQVGSIGVVATHTDFSAAEEKRGIKVTEITAGKYKRIASQHRPLSEEGRATIQEQVDHIYSVFVDEVAQNRGTDVDSVLAKMADGRIFLGKQAIEAGLVDGVRTLDGLIAELNQESRGAASAPIPQRGVIMANEKDAKIEVAALTAEDIQARETAAYDKGKAEGLAQGKSEGTTAERERIKAVEAQAMPGHEALIAEMKFDGKTTGPEAAVRVLAAEKEKRGKVLTTLKADAPNPVPHTDAPAEPEAAAAPAATVEQARKAGLVR